MERARRGVPVRAEDGDDDATAVASTSASEIREMTRRDGAIPKTARARRTVNQSFETTFAASWLQHQRVSVVRKHSSRTIIDACDATMNRTA